MKEYTVELSKKELDHLIDIIPSFIMRPMTKKLLKKLEKIRYEELE